MKSSAKLKNKYEKLNTILLFVIILFLFTPLFIKTFKPFNKTKLNGIADVNNYPKINIKNLKNGTFQKSFENYFMRSNNLWGYLVKLNNQISYDVFNQITFSYGPQAFVGKDGGLLQPMYLNSFNRLFTPDKSLMIIKTNKLIKLKSLLEKKGIKLLVVTNPNNLVLYPENIPNEFLDETRLTRENSYEIMSRYLKENNIPFVDNFKLLNDLKDKVNFKFFEPTGSHLNDIGACLGTNNLIKAINKALPNKNIKNYECFPVNKIYPPQTEDIDLLNVANLLFPKKLLKAGHYTPKAKKLYEKAPLNLLFVGTSFNFATQDALIKRNIAHSKLYFYYKSIRTDDGKFHPLYRNKIDWENDVFKNDVIILESNYSGLGGIGYYFMTDAIKKLIPLVFKNEKEYNTWKKEISPLLVENKNRKNRKQNKMDEFNPFENR